MLLLLVALGLHQMGGIALLELDAENLIGSWRLLDISSFAIMQNV